MSQEYLAIAIKAVQTSGDILIDYFGKLHDFRQKNQNIRDLVTEVDILSEKNIQEKIKEVFPYHAINGEEVRAQKTDSEFVWHIDPLDGTVNYSQGITLCAISIGLEKNGEIIAGATYNPFSQELFYASKGQGAFLNGKQIFVSQKKDVQDGLYAAAFSSARSTKKKNEYEIFGRMNDTTRGVLRTGSAALNLAYLACARIDGFWAKELFSWDLAAGILLVKEANGIVVCAKGLEYKLQDGVLIATNRFLGEPLVKMLVGL